MKITLWTTLFILFTCWAAAQKANFQFYNTADGLSGNITYNLVQDREGYLWATNDHKLHRFDGRKFLKQSLASACLISETEKLVNVVIYEDSLLLIAGETQVIIFNPQTESCETYRKPFDETKESFDLRGQDKNGDYQFEKRSENQELISMYLFQDGQFKITGFDETPIQKLPSLYDSNNRLYLFNAPIDNKIREVNSKGQTIRSIVMPEDCKDYVIWHVELILNDSLLVVAASPQEDVRILMAHVEDTSFFTHPVNDLLTETELNSIRTVRYIKEDELWLMGMDRQLIYYNQQKGTIDNFRMDLSPLLQESNAYLHVLQDRSGTYWVITQLGLIRIALPSYSFDQYFSTIEPSCNGYCSMRGIAEDPMGNIYSFYYGGLGKIDLENQVENLLVASGKQIIGPWGIYGDENGIWLNSGNLYNTKTDELIDIPGSSPLEEEGGLLSKGKDGVLWWALHHELFYLDTSDEQKKWEKKLELPQKGKYHTEAIQAGGNSGKVWISHKGRIMEYSPTESTQTWYDPADWNIPVSRIMAIEETPDSNLWLATDNGLVHFNPSTGIIKNFTVNEGLSDNFVCGLLSEADSCLWLSTNRGLSRFHIPSSTFINFFEEDGLTHNEFNRLSYYKARDGRMYFGGLHGITAFYPEEVMSEFQRQNDAAKVVLSSFEFVDEKQDTSFKQYYFGKNQQIDLYYGNRSFTFEYTLTDFRNPEAVFYSYQMEGYEDSWSTPSNFNFTRFSSLPSGSYTFRVKARDSRGLWHPNELAMKVVVHPPWWHTSWAYLGYFLLFCGLIYFIYSFLKRRLLLRNELQLKAEEARQLKELDTFKSRLYTNLTHEFRTPLTVILGMAQQMRNEPQKYLDRGTRLIENNGKNLLRLINQLLDLSKLEDQSFELDLKQGDIVPFIRYVTESFHTFANSKNLSLRFFTNQESLIMDYDEDQIQQVLTNLISNALKFTPEGGDILVKLTGDEKVLKLEVRDTGIGISEKDLPHVFDRFYQVDASSTRQGEGTGIGLAHSKELIKIMGGNIKVESILGQGSVFFINLPVKREAAKKIDEHHLERGASAIPLTADESIHKTSIDTVTNFPIKEENKPQLLIIEDNHDVVIYLKSCLDGRCQIDVAYNGKIGVEKAINQVPDIIISDVMMPEKDGYEVCDILKNDERTSHIPVILLTAKADDDSKMIGLRRGADAYLTKPFNKEELLLRLELLVERQKRMVAHFTKQLRGQKSTNSDIKDEGILIENAFIQKVRQIVEDHYSDENFNLSVLCQKIGMSRSQLFRKMQALIATSPSAFIRIYRLNKAKSLLETTDLNVSEVAWKVGFKDQAHFSKTYREEFGFSPSATGK